MSGDHDARLARLDDYLRRRDEDGGADAYEDELFARALSGDAPELALHDALVTRIGELAARGTLDPWVTASEIDALRALHGDRLAVIDLGPDDQPQSFEVPETADVLVTRVAVDLRGVERVDVEALTPDGTLIKTMPDARFDPADGALFACCEADLARVVGPGPVRMRAWAVRGGERRLLRELLTRSAIAG